MRRRNSVQAGLVTYELHTLGWKAFQDLCTAIASEMLGRPVQTFLPSKDGGRDGAFVGTWRTAPNKPSAKSTIQCKFKGAANATITLSDLKFELSKVSSLARRGLASDYVIMTNAGVTGTSEARIARAFERAGAAKARVFGRDWITAQIRERPKLRMMVPRLYGLGDLSQIIDERAYLQASYILSAMGDDLRCFVITDAFRKSVEALNRHSFVLLLGDPASGKSTIGASLAIGALDTGSIGTIRITSPDEFRNHWNPHEPTQFFWIDDAFGPTQYQRDLADGWNRQLPLLRGALKAGARILMTSRNYIWEAAKRDLKIGAFPLFGRSQVIINVHNLMESERAQILYNHVKMGDQSKKFRRKIKPFLPAVSTNRSFLPEIARRLGSTLFTENLTIAADQIDEFVEHPVDFLKDVLRNLDAPARAAIALIFLSGATGVPSPIKASKPLKTVARLLEVDRSLIASALETLSGSLTILINDFEGRRWRYKHPTISDAFASLVAESPELIEIYLDGAKLERLYSEVVCGDIEIEGAQVRIPPSLYKRLIVRLFEEDHWESQYFLTYRCDAAFLKTYLAARPSALDDIEYISAELYLSSKISFLSKLHSFGILPEKTRKAVSAKIAEITIKMIDGSVFYDTDVSSLLSTAEFVVLKERFEREIIGRLDDIVFNWEHDWSADDMPGHLRGLAESLQRYANFQEGQETEVSSNLLKAIEQVENRAAELESESGTTPTYEPPTKASKPVDDQVSLIFDDVDE